MAGSAMNGWLKEDIPDPDRLLKRVHRNHARDGELAPGAFHYKGHGMSTDWQKYSTPAETKSRARAPHDNGVVGMIAGEVRGFGLLVEHDPTPENRAHTEIIGTISTEMRVRLLRITRWVLPLETE